MCKKKLVICVLIIITISFGSIIKFNGDLKKREFLNPTVSPELIEEDAEVTKERSHEWVGEFIQLKYPNAISYPGINRFDVLISSYPSIVAYCKISTVIGNKSVSKIYLKKEERWTYYVPSNFDSLIHDAISFEFYDENGNFIKENKIAVEYDKNEKLIQIFEMKIERPYSQTVNNEMQTFRDAEDGLAFYSSYTVQVEGVSRLRHKQER